MFLNRPAQFEIARAGRWKARQFSTQAADDFRDHRLNIFDINQPLFFGSDAQINFARSRILQAGRRCRF